MLWNFNEKSCNFDLEFAQEIIVQCSYLWWKSKISLLFPKQMRPLPSLRPWGNGAFGGSNWTKLLPVKIEIFLSCLIPSLECSKLCNFPVQDLTRECVFSQNLNNFLNFCLKARFKKGDYLNLKERV